MPPDPEHRGAFVGNNGRFADHCDESDNLVEYTCESTSECTQSGCSGAFTGSVTFQTLDCAGSCVDGTCAARCPLHGDALTYLSVQSDGTATFRNGNDARIYSCEVQSENEAGYCENAGLVGTTVQINGLGIGTSMCAGSVSFNMTATDGTATLCSYRCQTTN